MCITRHTDECATSRPSTSSDVARAAVFILYACMVKRNDQVRRGQVIAKSGQSGTVTSPQLHFEIRKGSSPVDPMQFLPAA